MKGHLVKPSLESSSLGLVDRIIDRVPIGERRNSSKSPRLNDSIFCIFTAIENIFGNGEKIIEV